MSFFAKVVSIKNIRNQYFATLCGSTHKINIADKNPPLFVYSTGNHPNKYNNLNFVSYTCIKGDVIYRGYSGLLSEGDFVEFSNAG